jgi:5-methylcytosine-specific restriction enzyme B
MKSIEEYLHDFKEISEKWFSANKFVEKNYNFFQEFFKREYLEKAEWEDFQKIGEHLNSLSRMALARGRALGKPNHPIEHYRNSFIYLAYGEDDEKLRMKNLLEDKKYSISFFGESVMSEIFAYLFADRYISFTSRDRAAIKLLNIDLGFERNDTFYQKFLKFNEAIKPLVEKYINIVGSKIAVPINLEIDQFLSTLKHN